MLFPRNATFFNFLHDENVLSPSTLSVDGKAIYVISVSLKTPVSHQFSSSLHAPRLSSPSLRITDFSDSFFQNATLGASRTVFGKVIVLALSAPFTTRDIFLLNSVSDKKSRNEGISLPSRAFRPSLYTMMLRA